MEEAGREHPLRGVATQVGPSALVVRDPSLSHRPGRMGLLHQLHVAQGKAVRLQQLEPSRPNPGPSQWIREESGTGRLLGERPWAPHPNTSVLRGQDIPDEVGNRA